MAGFKTPEVEENVGCNLIPMIDIMFLMLLFFMLSADMTQREMEDLVLPQGDQVKEDPKEADKDPRTTINLFHRADGGAFSCPINKRGGVCREDEHWLIAIRSEEFTLETVKAKLKEIADEVLEPEPDPIAKKQLSRRKVIIRGDKAAPYGHVQKLIEICGTSGIYKIEVGAALPPKA